MECLQRLSSIIIASLFQFKQKAAEGDCENAQNLLGLLLMHGELGLNRDESEAKMWLERAQGSVTTRHAKHYSDASHAEGNRAIISLVTHEVSKEGSSRRKDKYGDVYTILAKRLDNNKMSQMMTLPGDATFEDLLRLLSSCWKDDRITAITLDDMQVTDLKQALSAQGLEGPRHLLIVSEVLRTKLKGGMEK